MRILRLQQVALLLSLAALLALWARWFVADPLLWAHGQNQRIEQACDRFEQAGFPHHPGCD